MNRWHYKKSTAEAAADAEQASLLLLAIEENKWRFTERLADELSLIRRSLKRRRLFASPSKWPYQRALQRRTPIWADLGAIRAIYREARRISGETGIQHHVDHCVPLRGRMVSGLHVHNNLQILTGSENSRKRNHFEVEA